MGSLCLGLTGYPLEHSLSPRLHAAAIDALGLSGKYSLYPVPPSVGNDAPLRQLLEQVRGDQIHGLNVTIPHKQTVIPLLDEISPTARAIGAVNTIFCSAGCLVGDNTDAAGFLADLNGFLSAKQVTTADQTALLLGAGGAARAVAYALDRAGWVITIAARRIEQAVQLAETLQISTQNLLRAIRLDRNSLEDWLSTFKTTTGSQPTLMIINTTPLGMFPNVSTTPWPEKLPFPPQSVVYDLVYNPQETTLVRAAHSAGLPAVTGLGMLVEQAVLSFETWTGTQSQHNRIRAAMRQAADEFTRS
jgi:shikimate dehydrogenase